MLHVAWLNWSALNCMGINEFYFTFSTKYGNVTQTFLFGMCGGPFCVGAPVPIEHVEHA